MNVSFDQSIVDSMVVTNNSNGDIKRNMKSHVTNKNKNEIAVTAPKLSNFTMKRYKNKLQEAILFKTDNLSIMQLQVIEHL